MKATIWLINLALAFQPLNAQILRSSDLNLEEQVNTYLLPFVEMKDFSGSVLIAQANSVIYLGSFGYANIERSILHDPYTIFPIHHLSQHFVASAILVLEKEGQLNTNLPINRIVPNLHPLGDRISIAHLLDHRSGIPDYWYNTQLDFVNRPPQRVEQILQWIQREPLEFTPGADKIFSHSNYILLAAIIQRISGTTYADYLQYALFNPLKMQQSGDVLNSGASGIRASGYNPGTGPVGLYTQSYYNRSILPGSTSLFSSISDLFIWHKSMIHFELFNPSLYPLSWNKSVQFNRAWYYLGGLAPGYAVHHSFYPEDELSVIVLSNIQSKAVDKIARDLAAMIFEQQYQIPNQRIPYPLLPYDLVEYEGKYIIDNEDYLIVKQQNMDLLLRDSKGPWMPLEILAKDTFFHKQQYVELIFRRNQQTQQVKSIIWDGYYEFPKAR